MNELDEKFFKKELKSEPMDVEIEPKEASEGQDCLSNAIEEEVLPNSSFSGDWNPETDRNAAET